MRKKVILWMPALILLISTESVNAQVIIGGNGTDEPHAGAGLDLSPLGADKLGLLLPNVELTDDAEEFALGEGGATPEDKIAATGMLVYNTAGVLHGKGLYIWNGTKWQPLTPAPTIKDIEGNEYFIGDFGTAGTWMTQNLRSTKNELYELTENANSGNSNSAYYYYPHAETGILTSHPEYGLLYTWFAASGRTSTSNEGNTSHGPHQGICPSGWHLPSDMEWNQLEQVIAESAPGVHSSDGVITWDVLATATSYRGTHAPKMKSRTAVTTTATNGTSNGLAANGFDALLMGYMSSGSAYSYAREAYFWSSSSDSSPYAWCRSLSSSYTEVDRYSNTKYGMFSVRCKKTDN